MTIRATPPLQETLETTIRLLERHRVLETIAQRHEGPKRELVEQLQHRQNLAELQRHLRGMHPADVAHVLEALPTADRFTAWCQLETAAAAAVFVELSEPVRASIADATERSRLVEILTQLDAEDLAYVSEWLPPDVLSEVSHVLEAGERTIFDESVRYGPSSIGHVMTRDWVEVHDHESAGEARGAIRARGDVPAQMDYVYVVDVRHILRGAVPVFALLVSDATAPVVSLVRDDVPVFRATDDVHDVAKAFERYDLVSAAVVDDRGKLIGRITVGVVLDLLRQEADLRALRSAGLSKDEDLFAAPWASARNRWPWLGLNLLTAFAASRVIGQFEAAIQQLAALAALMPIVASIGGNTGNQTMTLVIRGIAVDQISTSGVRPLLIKELVVSLMNGALWGALVGVFAIAMYANAKLGLVMSCAVVLNLLVAAASGVLVPLGFHAVGRDPAHGSGVLVTFATDAMGFFLFLGLATLFLT